MYRKFLKLPEEKRNLIINAAIKEFEANGYDNASTNTIVKDAEISKGSLFVYFKNKKDLYLYLYDYTEKLLIDEFWSKLDFSISGIIERWEIIINLKWELMLKHPDLFEFIQVASTEKSPEVRDEIEKRYDTIMADSLQKVYDGLNFDNLKDGVTNEEALTLVNYSIQGISKVYKDRLKYQENFILNRELIVKETRDLFALLKKCLYK